MSNEKKYEKPLNDLEKAHETEYFYRQNQELVKRLREKLHRDDMGADTSTTKKPPNSEG